VKPKAWSHTALETFENCPRQYYETKILKDRWPFVTTAEMEWGKVVHKKFENYLLYGEPLGADLITHKDFLDRFLALPGELAGEERIALDTNLKQVGYFGQNVWYRGQVDARKRDRATRTSHILDHKTGKVKSDFTQLKSFAMFEFLTQPDIDTVTCEFYWTQMKGASGETYTRDHLPSMLRFFAAKLNRYADAALTDTWITKPSGLCNGWCPVTNCEYWKPKRAKA
jgi:hypothetical protein